LEQKLRAIEQRGNPFRREKGGGVPGNRVRRTPLGVTVHQQKSFQGKGEEPDEGSSFGGGKDEVRPKKGFVKRTA